jgi:hypothetical protein
VCGEVYAQTAPVLVSPKQKSVSKKSTEVLIWKGCEGCRYIVQVDSDSTFESPHEKIVYESEYLFEIFISIKKTYYWRVQVLSDTSQSSWSGVRVFTIGKYDLEPAKTKAKRLYEKAKEKLQ